MYLLHTHIHTYTQAQYNTYIPPGNLNCWQWSRHMRRRRRRRVGIVKWPLTHIIALSVRTLCRGVRQMLNLNYSRGGTNDACALRSTLCARSMSSCDLTPRLTAEIVENYWAHWNPRGRPLDDCILKTERLYFEAHDGRFFVRRWACLELVNRESWPDL